MHLALDRQGVSVYTSPPKDKRLICLRHFLNHFRADRTHDFAVCHTGKIRGKDILEPVFFVSHTAEDILVQNVRNDIDFQPLLADVFEHILDTVRDFIGVVDRREIIPPEPLVEKAILYAFSLLCRLVL